jgi:hypothetical protein
MVEKDGGRSGYGSSSFNHFAFVVISFLFGHISAIVSVFFSFRLLYRCGCYINIAG